MSSIGNPIDTSLLQAAQAQQSASKARDKEKAATDRARRFADQVDLRVAGVESDEAIRKLPRNESEEAESEHRSRPFGPPRRERDEPQVDVTA